MRYLALALLVGILVQTVGCSGGLHRKGEQQFTVHGSWGAPISGDGIWPEGDGTSENWGATVGYGYFVNDRLALKVDVTPFRQYQDRRGDVTAGELQIGGRYHFAELPIGDTQLGFFAELYGGLMYSSKPFPEDGASVNFTQDAGVGF